MKRLALLLAASHLACAAATGDVVDPIARDVAYLTADERYGRGPEGTGRAESRDYIAAAFERAGLTPAFDDSYLQSFPGADGVEWVNVVGVIPGDADGHLLVGAHYDHLAVEEGIAGPVIYPGADDNASGVAALLALARTLSQESEGRSVLVAAFDGEEAGLLGSEHYAERPARPLDRLVAMINFDSVGRLRNDRLIIFGTGTASVFEHLLGGLNRSHGFDLALNAEGVGAGDHETFFRRGVPVLHLFTDAHLDYHRPTDTPDKLDHEGISRVTDFAVDMLRYLRDPGVALDFIPQGAEKLRDAEEPPKRRRVRFGTIPDFARESGGVLVSGLVPNSPASRAGIAAGDVIVAIDETAIDNLYDYQSALASREPGDEITVIVLRAGERLTFTATLEARR